MSSPVSIGDVVLLSNIAWKVYQGFKSAPSELKALSTQARSIHYLVKQIEESFEKIYLNKHQREYLRDLVARCTEVLKGANRIIKHYEAIRSHNGKMKKLGWLLDHDGIQQVKQDLMDQVSLLTAFNSTIAIGSLAVIKNTVDGIALETPERPTHPMQADDDLTVVDWQQRQADFDDGSVSPKETTYPSLDNEPAHKDPDKLTMGPGKGKARRCVFCGESDHDAESCERMRSFDCQVGSLPDPLTIPEDDELPPTSPKYSDNLSRQSTAPASIARKKKPSLSTFGADSSIGAGFGPGSGPQLPIHHRPSSASTSSSSSLVSRQTSNDGSVVTDPGPKKRTSLKSSISGKISTLGSSSPSAQHGFGA